MAIIRLTAAIEFKVDTSDNAHELGKELEDRINSSLNVIIPNLRYTRSIETGTVQFSHQIIGRRIKIENIEKNKADGAERED